MADSYVTSGATIKCSCGDKTAKLTVYPDRTVFLTEKPMANISDHVSMYNIWPFGKCRTTSYPATGAATAANHGTLTPMPCVPGTISEWLQGKGDYIIKGKPALLKSSYCRCQWGGIITITNDGQTDTGDADLNRVALQSEEEMLKKQEEEELAENAKLDVNAILDGIQTALDLAGFAPGLGAVPDLLNAAISACRGNWAEAGLSVLAAVPGIGDAAAATKLVGRGVKAAKKTGKVGDAVKTVNKTDKTANVGKMTKASEEYDSEKLRRIRAERMGIDPDATGGGSGLLYDTAPNNSNSPKFLELTVRKEKTDISEYLSKSDIADVEEVRSFEYIQKESANPSVTCNLQIETTTPVPTSLNKNVGEGKIVKSNVPTGKSFDSAKDYNDYTAKKEAPSNYQKVKSQPQDSSTKEIPQNKPKFGI